MEDILSINNFNIVSNLSQSCISKQEESARERALCQLTECFWFVKVIRGQNNYQEKGCTEIQ